jgi:hypothetical protein
VRGALREFIAQRRESVDDGFNDPKENNVLRSED